MYTLNNLPGRFFVTEIRHLRTWRNFVVHQLLYSIHIAFHHLVLGVEVGVYPTRKTEFSIYIYISPAGFLVLTVCNMSLDSLKNLLPEGKNRNSDHGTYDICNGDTAMGVACWINITKGSFFWKTSHKWWGRSLQHSKTEAWKNFLPSPQSRMKYCSNFLE